MSLCYNEELSDSEHGSSVMSALEGTILWGYDCELSKQLLLEFEFFYSQPQTSSGNPSAAQLTGEHL